MTIADQETIKRQLQTVRTLPIESPLLAAAERSNGSLYGYILFCLSRFSGGGWGKISKLQYTRNIESLLSGNGVIIGRYNAYNVFFYDLVIQAHFSQEKTGSVTIKFAE